MWAYGQMVVFGNPTKVGQTVNEKKSTGQYVTLSNAFVGPFPKSTFSPRDRDPPALLFWFVTRHLIRISGRSRREAESEKNLCSGKKILPSRISNLLFEPVSRPKNERQIRNTNPVFCHPPIYTVCPYRITCRQVPSDQDIQTRDASHSFFIVLCEATRGTTGERTAPVAYIKGR